MEDRPVRTRLSFSIRTVLEIIAIVALVLALLYGRFEEVMGRNGRYQIFRGTPSANGSETVYLLDTKTGKLWSGIRQGSSTTNWIPAEPDELSDAPSAAVALPSPGPTPARKPLR